MVLVVAGLVGYLTLHYSLNTYTTTQLSSYHDVVQMPARTADITITLP